MECFFVILLKLVVVLDLCGYDAVSIHLDAECLALFDFPEKKTVGLMEGHSPQSEQGGNWRWIPFQRWSSVMMLVQLQNSLQNWLIQIASHPQ